MEIGNPTSTVLYLVERTIKEYRKYAQKRIGMLKDDITIDQCLILIIINNDDTLSQKEIAELIFKDYASLTRMINLMVKNNYLIRKTNTVDRRILNLKITAKGRSALVHLRPKIIENRQNALNGISNNEIKELENILKKIISNCKNQFL